jgi:hypothetical protein
VDWPKEDWASRRRKAATRAEKRKRLNFMDLIKTII